MHIEALVQAISEALQPHLAAIQSGQAVAPLGLRRSARLPTAAALYDALQWPVVLITDRADHALALLDELGLWAPQAPRLLFPEPTPLFYEEAAWGDSTRRDRLMALTTLAVYHIPGAALPARPPLLVAPARALMTRTMPRRDFLKAARSLRTGQTVQPDEIARTCYMLGYEATNTVIAAGQFARRGGILDLWPPAEPQPVRIEFFGDEIETLRRFDPATQRTVGRSIDESASGRLSTADASSARVLLTPAREYLVRPEADAAHVAPPEGKSYSEFMLPLLHPTPASLLDYLPRQALVLLDDQQALQEAVDEVEEQAVQMRQEAVRDGLLPADYPAPYLTWSEIEDSLDSHPALELGGSLASLSDAELFPVNEPAKTNQAADLPVRAGVELGSSSGSSSDVLYRPPAPLTQRFSAGPRFAGRLKPLMEHLQALQAAGEQAVIVSRQAARLQELWAQAGRSGTVAAPDGPERSSFRLPSSPPPTFLEGSLSEGWTFQARGSSLPVAGAAAEALHLLTDGEIFGWRRPEPRRRARPLAEAPESGYSDLQPGDYVVHVDHGIGHFVGLVRRTVDGAEREYLCVEYADDAQLFVPVHQVDRLTRYVGPDNRSPSLSRLGSPEWRTVKANVKEAVQDVAEDLLELYAQRNVIEGYRFSEDNPWQQELEASFPYVETEDQLRVLAEVKHDMQSGRPMDRLICGDVGYGKTEVALRAAFKAVNDSRQVAILVPTTVLAQQHYNTFHQRLAAFPVEVEMLSRFRTPQQQRDIIKRLALGQIDILIGTHRLFSSDVQFKDLGLLIIDEEQRFGVMHKETLKQMRTEVDVLTLTATPIPRTLYMALSGVRDISTINTPPEERLPIVTHVGPYSPRLVRQAILREMERGGQVFFVHNRVQTIRAMQTHLNQLIPEARIAVAHGQMPESALALRMEEFTRGDVDILLSTSIIESGLDIPNANTLIVDRADTFGLAQLYQLRGRVGRGAQRAYAYFFRHNRKSPTVEGRQRLDTIAENTQLGAGFSIAMRDLEIRGTGDILGTRQHGHIAAVGFHLYTSMLAEAVRKLRKGPGTPTPNLPSILNLQLTPVNVELPLPIGLPAEYVTDKTVRLGLYRRMADLRSLSELDALQEELTDRFGEAPDATSNLFYQLKAKLLAEKAGLASVLVESGQIVLRFPDGIMPENLPELGARVRVGKVALWMPYSEDSNWQEELLEVLERVCKEPLK